MERNYTTQMDAARRGIVTPELETVAKKERMTVQELRSPEHDDTCSMCGKFCAVRSMNKALSGEHIDIL